MNRFLIASLAGAAALALSAQSAMAKPTMLQSTLSGAEETAGGAPGGSGTFTGSLDAGSGDLCYELKVAGIGEPTAAHIHAGAVGADGAPVATIEVTGDDGELCLAIPVDAAKLIAADPSAHYVNVHTEAFPNGAVRGQLDKAK